MSPMEGGQHMKQFHRGLWLATPSPLSSTEILDHVEPATVFTTHLPRHWYRRRRRWTRYTGPARSATLIVLSTFL